MFYENDTLKFINTAEGRYIPMTNEYQYHLKDLWNNIRVTFTTKSDVDTGTATMEDANEASEEGKFLYYDESVKVNAPLFDHTNAGGTFYSTRLNGSNNERTGLARSISVMPGDTIRTEVYAKYLDPNSSNWTQALNNLITSIANGTAPAGTFIDEGGIGSTGGATAPYLSLLDKSSETGTAPKAYLNYLILDRDYNLINGGFVRMTTGAREYGQDGPHEKLAAEFVINKAGYVYIYLSNDNSALGGSQIETYWDDFKVTQVKSPIIQTDDYTPFGVTFNSFRRENSLENRTKFQAQERISDLSLGWDSFKYRNYMSDIGRFFNVDPLSDKYVYNSTYAFAENKLGRGVELEGKELWSFLEGAGNALLTNHHPTQAGRGSGLETTKDQDAYLRGQQAGDFASLVIGGVEAVGGALASAAGIVGEIPTVGLSTTVVIAGGALAAEGLSVVRNASQKLLNSGSYTNTHESGKRYHGKGPRSRAEQSAERVANENNDPAVDTDWTPAENDAEAFKQEATRIENDGGIENPDNYNKINSPGKKLLEQEKKTVDPK